VSPVKLKINAAPANREHPAHLASPVVTATPVKQAVMAIPVVQDVMLSLMSVCDQCQISALVLLIPDPPDQLDLPATMVNLAMLAALARMVVPVALENPDPVVLLVSLVSPAIPDRQETPVRRVLVVPLPPADLDHPVVQAPRDLPASLATPAKQATTVLPEVPGSLEIPVSPVNLVNPEPQEMLEITVVKEAATTAHLLVWLLAIKPFSDKIFRFGKRDQRFLI